MRGMLYSFIVWIGILQVPMAPLSQPLASAAQLLGVAGALASLTIMVYRLGVWRQEMYNTKHDVGAEVARYREESSRSFERLERRFIAIDHFVAAANEQRVATERWRARVDARLDGLDRDVLGFDERIERLEGEGA